MFRYYPTAGGYEASCDSKLEDMPIRNHLHWWCLWRWKRNVGSCRLHSWTKDQYDTLGIGQCWAFRSLEAHWDFSNDQSNWTVCCAARQTRVPWNFGKRRWHLFHWQWGGKILADQRSQPFGNHVWNLQNDFTCRRSVSCSLLVRTCAVSVQHFRFAFKNETCWMPKNHPRKIAWWHCTTTWTCGDDP